jgi:hypothetical protein
VTTAAAETQSLSILAESKQDNKDKEEDDAVSMLSSSSKSMRFKSPGLRRRVTDSGRSERSRRASEAASEEDSAALGIRVGLEIQGAGKEGWGIGDDARMGLE